MEPNKFGEYSIEEYKTLRAEILRTADASEKNVLACITANGVALAYGAKEENFFVLLFACLVPIYFWIQHIRYKRAAAKLSAYISVFLEGPYTGLRWETRVHRADVEGNRKTPAYMARAILLPYPLLLIVSLLTLSATAKPASLNLPVVYVALICAILAIIIIARSVDYGIVELRGSWLSIFQAIKAEEANALSVLGDEQKRKENETLNPQGRANGNLKHRGSRRSP